MDIMHIIDTIFILLGQGESRIIFKSIEIRYTGESLVNSLVRAREGDGVKFMCISPSGLESVPILKPTNQYHIRDKLIFFVFFGSLFLSKGLRKVAYKKLPIEFNLILLL